MEIPTKDHKISEWLEKLQQESWNLELLVSGFFIFILYQAGDPLLELRMSVLMNSDGSQFPQLTQIFLIIIFFATWVLICNLVIHVILRGIWIGVIGLLSVPQRASWDTSRYHRLFKQKVLDRLTNLKDLAVRLDATCSVIFAISFLLVFMLISFSLFIFIGSFLAFILNALGDSPRIVGIFRVVFMLSYLFLGLIYFIDTLTLGVFKRAGWLSRIYFPIHRFFSFTTGSILYRSIYYHLISKVSPIAIRIMLFAYVIVIVMIPFSRFNYHTYFPDLPEQESIFGNVYDDERPEERYIKSISIDSRIISSNFLTLFIRYIPTDNKALKAACPDLQTGKKGTFITGFSANKEGFSMGDPERAEVNSAALIACLESFYQVFIDDKKIEVDMHFYVHPNLDQKGLSMVISLDSLEQGKHKLEVKKQVTDEWITHGRLLFWNSSIQ